jgi:D-glycero-beta-D-manno-heptose 1-phosphate adenylyltransferase
LQSKVLQQILHKILLPGDVSQRVENWRRNGEKIVFTNGCFDIIHKGHIDYLSKASSLGTKFIVALNSDASVTRLKGNKRPLQSEDSRAMIMASFLFTDAVVFFDEDTPEQIIEKLKPDVLVKGGDYSLDLIVGAKTVISTGGSVVVLPFLKGYSTTSIEKKIRLS